MYVEEISIDGFKSYARRATLSALDPAFNAITGLNGSGKSNVLDAICFVLGISNLEQVRAQSLQELVYKQGQAGVTKASVSITFNNSDTSRSPVGYEQYSTIDVSRQVVIGGRSTYRINGKKVQPKAVQEMFHSVQLNVNNPHFLIMQGRIQKVLSMKPPEILSLLEEAAGTRMYESKKESALKTLRKKQEKVDEIDQVLENEIYPQLERLRKEKEEHDRWCELGDRIKRLHRFVVAYEYSCAADEAKQRKHNHSQLLEQLSDASQREHSLRQQVKQLQEGVDAKTTEKEAQLGENFTQLRANEDSISKALVKATTSWENKKESLQSEQQELERLEAKQQALAQSTQEKQEEETRLQQAYNEVATEHNKLAEAADHAERAVHGMHTGKGTGDTQSLTEQLSDAKGTVNSSKVDAEAAEKKAKQLEADVSSKREQLEAKQSEADNVTCKLDSLKLEVSQAKSALDNHDHDSARAEEAQQKRKELLNDVEALKTKVETLSGQLSGLEFRFKDPEHNFDRNRVKGAIGKLVTVRDSSATTALEVVAGGKLYQVIVDNEDTGKKVLEHGQLQKRVTLIPLNKIQTKQLSSSTRQRASEVSNGKATPAIDLVDYDEKFKNAMMYAFGTSFVCPDNDTAKAVAYDKHASSVCVTPDGDLHNPAGLLTGGSRSKRASILSKVRELKDAEAEIQQKRQELKSIEAECQKHEQKAKDFREVQKQHELKEQEFELAQQRLQYTEASQLMESLEKAEKDLKNAKEAAQTSWRRHEEASKRVKELETKIAAFENDREGQYERAVKDAKEKREAEKQKRQELENARGNLEAARAEREAAEVDEGEVQEQLHRIQESKTELEQAVKELEADVASQREKYEEAHRRVEEQRSKAKEADEELQELMDKKKQTEEAQHSAKAEAKKAEKEAEKEEKARKEAEEKRNSLREKHTWIPTEERQFGLEGSDYDFSTTSPEEKKEELQKVQKEHESLERRVNKAVVSSWDTADAQYKELSAKRKALANDKEKIESVIGELDEKKEEALRQTWQKVDSDLASIFSLLLPGSSAKLEPEAGKSFLQGLEIRVQLGDAWKESLSELSGGQRSLLALSFILSLLLFKPAPIYILDEVDAALDPSHTQNIGKMIKEHFPFSQFIIVSLKEGMFSNANALFRTYFVDGTSTVVREKATTQNGSGNNNQRNLPNTHSTTIAGDGADENRHETTQPSKRRKQNSNTPARRPLTERN